ncbi:MAG: hypothetical protein D6714_09240, partial [Bacteroidetes bacterium]
MKDILLLMAMLFSVGAFSQNECNPNDVFSEACPISFGEEVKGTINPTNDNDYYKFEVTTPGVIEVNVSNVPSNISMLVRLYGPSQEHLISDDGIAGQSVFIKELVCEPGTYYVLL